MRGKRNFYNTTTMIAISLEILIVGAIFLATPRLLESGRYLVQFGKYFDREVFGIVLILEGIWGMILSYSQVLPKRKSLFIPENWCLLIMSTSVGILFCISLHTYLTTGLSIFAPIVFLFMFINIWIGIYGIMSKEIVSQYIQNDVRNDIQKGIEERKEKVGKITPH